jgi:hypothetical protein
MTGMISSMRWTTLFLTLGCTTPATDPGLKGYSEDLCTESGVANLNINVSNSETALLITVDGEDLIALDEIKNPDGDVVLHWNDWYTEKTFLTSAVWPLSSEMVLNWPIRAEDGYLSAGQWTVTLAAVDGSGNYKSGSCLTANVQSKEDPSFASAEVNVRLVYAEGVDELDHVTTAVNAAIDRWRDIWAPMGLYPNVRITTGSIDPDLPYVGQGSEDIYNITMDSYEDEITLVVGETIDGGTEFLGVAGSIPGTLTANTRSAVVMGWIASAGLDGNFSELDISIMGETMAHEVGHYMGLFHPVEQTWDSWDACSDTPDCRNQNQCENQLGDNLMYPAPICDFSDCLSQDQLSGIQVEILQRYTGAL